MKTPVSLRTLAALLVVFVAPSTAWSNPHVVGYERFHSGKPSPRGGAVLYSELGCANCHGGSAIEMPRKGPALSNLANRVQYDWVIGFLKNPQAGHEGSTMPGLTHDLNQADVEAIASWLGTIGKGKAIKPPRHANAERGSAIYHEKGCVACHAPTPDYHGPHPGAEGPIELAVPFPDLKKKYSLTSLSHFLANVSSFRTDGRMPHIEVTSEDSQDLAAHLLDVQSSDPRELPPVPAWPKADKKRLDRGKALITKLNCAACHSLPGIKPAELRPLGNRSGGCLSDSPIDSLPFYDLSSSQKESLEAFLNSDPVSDDRLTFAALNCFACHSRDGIGGPTNETNPFFVGNESLGDSGRLPPPLTGIGHKLQAKWLEDVLHGKKDTPVRPYLKTQMPKYPALAGQLSQWLTKIDHHPDATPLALNPGDNEAGKKLLGIHGGVNCITCHHWEDKKSLGIPGPDISALDQRLRPEWFREYLLNPAGYRPGTLMPPLWPGGKSAIPGILEGDTEKQIAAIWGFIRDGKGVPEGFPDRSSGEYELLPTDRPIIQRTFFEKTGSKAILVGFPGNIHLAYDGMNGKPSLVWRGKFFDAYNTWYTRAAPFEKPLSDEVYEFSPLKESNRFRGYLTDKNGNPTFILSRGKVEILDSYEVKDGKLIRTMDWSRGEPPAVTHPSGVEIETHRSIPDAKQVFIYHWK